MGKSHQILMTAVRYILLRWGGFLTDLILGAIVSLASSIVLGAKYLASMPATSGGLRDL